MDIIDKKCLEANIEDNEYTIYSMDDLDFELGVFVDAVNKKSLFIENQIVARTISNVTPEKLEGFTETFKQFDASMSNCLSREEFRAALRAEGIHYSVLNYFYKSELTLAKENEFDKIFIKTCHGEENCSFQHFIDFMRAIGEDKTTPEQLNQAFESLSHNKEYITDMELTMGAMKPEILAYFKTTMPRIVTGEGYEYRQCKILFISLTLILFLDLQQVFGKAIR